MRNYEHTPRPEIEYHPHIRMLIEGQEKRSNDRIYHREKEKQYSERQEEIDKYKPVDIIEFWCSECQQDFAHLAYKQVEIDWSNPRQKVAFYKGVHEDCGTWAIRYITDRNSDPYWMQSAQVARDRGEHFADLLQPFETGFDLMYGRKNKS